MTFVHRETVRFRDLDSLGHMNNAVYATFVEQARIAFLSPQGADVENMIRGQAPKRIGMTFIPTRIVSWDHSKLGGTY